MAQQRPSPVARVREEIATHAQPTKSRPGTIGHALPRYREAGDWTRDELAEWLGVSLDGLAAIMVEPINDAEQSTRRYGIRPRRLRDALG